jgi:hypothetical protein
VRFAVGGLSDAHRLGGDGDAGAVHQSPGVADQAVAAFAHQAGRGVIELDLARRRGMEAHLVLQAADAHRLVGLDLEQG